MINLNGYSSEEISCKCGKTHSAYTKKIETGEGASDKLADICKQIMREGRIGIVADENVRAIAENAESALVRAGYRTRMFSYSAAFESTRENAQKLITATEDVRLWIAVGCGSIADTVRYAATCRGNEWIMFITAPTTDSMLYPYCDYIEEGVRITVKATPPIAVVADYDVIENAPKFTVAAGYGTLISKLLHTFDFYFDEITDKRRCSYLTGEFCENLSEFFKTQSCEPLAPRICRTLIRLGIVAQLADEEDFCQGGEYFAARCLRSQCGNSRLIGENAAICALSAYCILNGYLKTSPEDLFIPSAVADDFRYLDKTCHLNGVRMLKDAKINTESDAHLYILKEYASDMCDKLNSLLPNVNGMARQFRRLYDDAGYWLGSYCSVRTALKTLCAASAAHGNGLLSSLVRCGALEDITA